MFHPCYQQKPPKVTLHSCASHFLRHPHVAVESSHTPMKLTHHATADIITESQESMKKETSGRARDQTSKKYVWDKQLNLHPTEGCAELKTTKVPMCHFYKLLESSNDVIL